jgi:hypothetical protein
MGGISTSRSSRTTGGEKLARHLGPLYPVRTLRRARAGFKTWQRAPVDTLRYRLMRASEDARYYAKRLRGKSNAL